MSDQRKYSLDEIDDMREAVADLMTYWAYSGRGYREKINSPDPAEVEDQLRTHMLNGTEPSDLTERARQHLVEGLEDSKRLQSDIRHRARYPILHDDAD